VSPDQRIVEAALIDQDSTEIDQTLEMIRVDLQRLLECALSLGVIAGFPRRQPEHEVSPRVRGSLLRVLLE
jgi:hypothetical protein